MYSAGMVTSASSSNTQWWAGFWTSSSARPADAIPLWRRWVSGAAAAAVSDVMVVSSLFRLQDQVGGMLARTDRAFARRGQTGVGPVAGQKQVLEVRRRTGAQRILLGRRLKGRPPLAYDLPRRQRTLSNIGAETRHLADIPPDVACKVFTRQIHEPLCVAVGDRETVGERKQPFDQPADHSGQCRNIGRRHKAKMRVENGAEFRRRLDIGHQA